MSSALPYQDSILDLFSRIQAPPNFGPATQEDIFATEKRLGGKLPERFLRWHLEADGFNGEAEVNLWRFPPLRELVSLKALDRSVEEMNISSGNNTWRSGNPEDYVIICDQMIYLPFYAVNIRPESLFFGEVISSAEEWLPHADLAATTFDGFADALFQSPEDVLITPAMKS